MNKKYEFTGETMEYIGRTLRRIRALRELPGVKVGDIGGWLESESNLAHEGDCWVYGDARVYGSALVSGDAEVSDSAKVYGGTVERIGDYVYMQNFWSSWRGITYVRSRDTWTTGCFAGTTEELLAKAAKDSPEKAEAFRLLVEFVKGVYAIKEAKNE